MSGEDEVGVGLAAQGSGSHADYGRWRQIEAGSKQVGGCVERVELGEAAGAGEVEFALIRCAGGVFAGGRQRLETSIFAGGNRCAARTRIGLRRRPVIECV